MGKIVYFYFDPAFESWVDAASWATAGFKVYQDADLSRPQLRQLLADLKARDPVESAACSLFLRRLEELGQSLQEVADCLRQLEDCGVQLWILGAANHTSDLPSPETLTLEALTPDAIALMTANATAVAAQNLTLLVNLQQQQRSRQRQRGHALNRLHCKPPPGRPPYGYQRGSDCYELDRAVLPILRDFFEHFLLYGSLRSAVRFIAHKHGKRISVSAAQRWLTHPVYRGDLQYQRNVVQSDTHLPILSREEAAQIDRLLRRNRRLPPRTASAPRSLAGLVTCQACCSPMHVSRVKARQKPYDYLYLRPMACPQKPKCKALAYEAVLEKAIQEICRCLPRAVSQMPNLPPMDLIKGKIQKAIAAKQAVLAQLPALITQDILDTHTADLRAYTLNNEIAQLQARLAQAPPVNLTETSRTVSIPQFWFDLSESERRFYFREFIKEMAIARDESGWNVVLHFIF